jgi:hypothetical protein|tara:strand:- start:1310 stop:1441 length:132 start_codon:yes stop_codon:yes gene_type:complete
MKEVQSHQRKEIKREREKTSFFPRTKETTNKQKRNKIRNPQKY